MKKVVCITVFLAVAVLVVNAQKMDVAKVPAAVKTTFEKKYPGSIAKWELEDGKYEASFKMAKTEMSATFEATGTLVESEEEIKTAALPAGVLAYVKSHYNKLVKEAAKITLANGSINYEAHISGKDLIFDASGNFIKELKD
jgi:uncharacterized membrane protein YkoI